MTNPLYWMADYLLKLNPPIEPSDSRPKMGSEAKKKLRAARKRQRQARKRR